ncbi:MAG: transcription antitermination factor NusB [Minicystis sp.]
MTKIVAPQTISPARAAAVEVLARVWESSAFAAVALDAELRRDDLDPRDAALATELVYGVLRTEAYLDDRVAALASRKTWAKDARVRAHVLVAAYTLSFLDRIPTFAAVSEAVAGARAAGGERVAGFANAVLRKLASEVEGKRPALADAVMASAPGWLRGALRRSLGRSGAAAYLAAGPVPPPIGLCVAKGEDRAAWIAKLQAAVPNATIEPGQVSPRAILVRGAGDVRRLPGAGEAWIVQEEGAQVVALAAGAKPGERVLDACAGHGNKTWLLADEVGRAGLVDAADLYAAKLAQLREGPPGKFVHQTFAIDWTAGTGEVPEGYDRVIVDAPCSGVGTLRRRPEIARHREAEDLARLAALQIAIARRAATRVKEGGRLVFAVCSVLREEGEDVVDQLAATDQDGLHLEATPFDDDAARALAGGGHMLRVLPHVQGTDGYFVASFTVRRTAR